MNIFTRVPNKFLRRTKNEVNTALNSSSVATLNKSTKDISERQVFDLTNESPEASPTTNGISAVELIEEHDTEHVVLESSHVKQTIEQSEVFTNPSPPQHRTTASTRNVPTRRKRGQSSPEERRALGSIEPEPEDCVRIPIPLVGVSQDQMSSRNRFKPFKPTNTLDHSRGGDIPRGGRSRLLLEIDGRTTQIQGNKRKREDPVSAKSQNLRRDDHSHHFKKPRVETAIPKVSTSRSVISIDSNDEVNVSDDLNKQQCADMMTTDSDPARSDKHAESIKRSQHTKQDERYRNGSVFPESSSLEKVLNKDQETIAHRRRGTRRSQGKSQNQPDATQSEFRKKPDQMFPSSPSIEGDRRTRPSRLGHSSNISPVRGSEPKRQSIVSGSPDPLQDDMNSPISQTKARQPFQDLTTSDFTKTKPSGRRRQSNRTRQSISNQGDFECSIESIVAHGWDKNSRYMLRLSAQSKIFSLTYLNPRLGTGPLAQTSVDKIVKIEHAPNDKKLLLRSTGEFIEGSKLCLQFTNDTDLSEFVQRLQEQFHTKVQNRDAEYMTKAFEHWGRQIADHNLHKPSYHNTHPLANPAETTIVQQPETRSIQKGKRPRMIDSLDNPHSNSPDPLTFPKPSYKNHAVDESMPTTRTSAPTSRSTRATARTASPYTGTTSQTHKDAPNEKSSITNIKSQTEVHKSWRDVSDIITAKGKKPLVIQGPGKKSESISWEDLERLNDDQFLNDNLISFFLLYLQKCVDPMQLRRMHFFNTFFFSTLTKDMKGKSGINYKAVARWTKNVNLFSRDFVIVPVNENLHWFVMIICNLPYLKNDDKGVEVVEDLSGEDTLVGPNKVTSKSDVEPELQTPEKTTESFQELSLEDNVVPKSSGSTPLTARKGRKILRGRKAQKYDVDKPIIITLDSLDQPRSSTASALRRYVVELASDINQSGVPSEVDASSIKGMTAKGIPHQNNFSDCGLYLCMYMEQFMRNPDAFVRKILQRDDHGEQWPKAVVSRDLRERLAKLIDKLYHEQEEKQAADDMPTLGSILVDMLPPDEEIEEIDPPETTREISDLAAIKSAREKWEAQKQQDATRHLPSIPSPPNLASGESDELLRGLQEAASQISNLGSTRPDRDYPLEPLRSSNHRERRSMHEVQSTSDPRIIQSLFFDAQQDQPFADHGRFGNDIPLDSATELRSARHNRALHRSRSNSVSTDFLTGDQSYVKELFAKDKKLRTDVVSNVTPVRFSTRRSRTNHCELRPEISHPPIEIAATDDEDEGISELQNPSDEDLMLV